MIVDAHCHLGYDEVFDEDFTKTALLDSCRANGIDAAVVQPALVHDLDTVRRYHDDIAELCAEYPGRFRGMANPNPHLPGETYEREVERCVCELGFVGVKLHPLAHAVNPRGRHGYRAFEVAARLGVPVMVHTGLGIPWSAPALLDGPAERYPDLAIVVAHAGGGIFAGEAAVLAARFENVFLELSWTAGFFVRHLVEAVGADRLMFGSDHADNAALELTKLRSLGLEPAELNRILGQTARAVWGLDRVPGANATEGTP